MNNATLLSLKRVIIPTLLVATILVTATPRVGEEAPQISMAETLVVDDAKTVITAIAEKVPERREELSSRGRAAEHRRMHLDVVSTCYTTASDETPGTGLAYDGREAVPYHTIAVDPKVIPLGSLIYIKEIDIWGLAHDTGSAIKGHKIDICVSTKKEAFKWGRKTITVIVVPPEKPYKMNW